MTAKEEARSGPDSGIHWPREDLTLFLTAVLCLCLSIYFFVARLLPRTRRAALGFGSSTKRVLLVTAHPDDEVMFFGPTLASLCKNNNNNSSSSSSSSSSDSIEVMLLCLSYGDYRGGGLERKRELYESCRELGLPEENITVLRYTRLKDDPGARWREELVSEVVLRAVVSARVDTVVTFDRGGVSGHKNHVALHNAMALLCLERRLPAKTRVFCLRSVSLLRKYLPLVDLPLTLLLAPAASLYLLSGPSDWWKLQRAMSRHRSQYVWFRKLYMVFSRYIFINTYDRLLIPPTKKPSYK